MYVIVKPAPKVSHTSLLDWSIYFKSKLFPLPNIEFIKISKLRVIRNMYPGFRIRIRRIRMFLACPDPDPDPHKFADPDPGKKVRK